MWNPTENGEDDEGDEDDYSDEELERIGEQVCGWWEEFKTSPLFQQLSEAQQGEAFFIIRNFAEFAYDYEEQRPENWDHEIVEEYCLEYAPRKVSAERSFFQAVEPVLANFFTFLQPRGVVADPPQMLASLHKCATTMVSRSQNPANWGSGKSIAMRAIADGKDPSEPAVMYTYAMIHNMEQLAMAQERHHQTTRPASPRKLGRNEPCPCGSGLKYKKCCDQRINSTTHR